jgi:hypothetical protein
VKATKRILLYGNSLILESVGNSLGCYSQFEVTKLEPPPQETQKIDAATTDILLYDLETIHPEAVFPLLETNPNLQLIGVSQDINLVKIWSMRELREVSMQDLLKVIRSEVKDSPIESGVNEVRLYRSVVNK